MKINETPEMLLTQAYNSVKLKRLATVLVLVGTVICLVPLLPPVQKALFLFVDAYRGGTSNEFESKLQSLLSLSFFGLVVLVLTLCCLFSKAVAAFMENAKNTRMIVVLAAAAGTLLLLYISVFSYQHGWQWLNSDHSSEMVLGKLLSQENVFVSRNWHYSTEIRLIYQTIFTMPLFKLFARHENWALIRTLNILLNNLVLIFSYLFMAKQMKIGTKWICITALFLLMPVSAGYWGIVTFGGYYIFFIAQLFCCIGLFIRLAGLADGTAKAALPGFIGRRSESRAKACFRMTERGEPTKGLIPFILFTALSFALGAQGIRSLLCVHFPLLIACIWFYVRKAQKKNFSLFLGCYGFAVCCIGFAVNYLLHFWYSFHSFDNMRLANLYTEFLPKLSQSLISLAGFFGLSVGSSLLSAQGLFSVIAIIGTFLLFWVISKSFRQINVQDNATTQPPEHRFIQVFFIASVIFNIFVFIVVDEGISSRYFIPFMVLYVPLIAILFEHVEKNTGHLKFISVICGIVLFIFGQSYLNFQTMVKDDRNSVRNGYIQYLLDNRLDYGFATFWNANITTELSNGKIELAGIEPYGLDPDTNHRFNIQGWLNPVKFYSPSYHQGESFLLLTRAEWDLARETGRPFALLQPDYNDGNFIVIRYPSAGMIHSEVLDN